MNASNPASAGILTFLFTDLEGSTPLWEKDPERMQEASARHDEILRDVFEANRGRVVKTTGDGFHVVFDSPVDGLAAALAAQQAMLATAWPEEIGALKIRVGLHSGESKERDGDFYGPEIIRAARIMGLAHGGQVLVSSVTASLVRERLPDEALLQDLGAHRLKGIREPEKIYQLTHHDLPSSFPPLATPVEIPNNLPPSRTKFIGREAELAEIEELIEGTRLLTLRGPGGTGKTRLMLQAATDVIDRFPDGVWLVELASLAEGSQVIEKLAGVLKVQEQNDRSLEESVAAFLHRRAALLLLDNVEHLVQACAEIADQLLDSCPFLCVMASSREPLFIDGETIYQVPSLSLPEKDASDPQEILRAESVRLFVDRALAVRRDFVLDPASATAVVEIVRRLDGIPLALELAAARLGIMSASQIAARLNDRFRLLVGGKRTDLPRQQTLQALIDWSWNLLEDEERVLLRRLAVFSGGWTIEDAQQAVSAEPLDEFSVLDHLETLTHKSLVTVEREAAKQERFRLLENIRQYALARLEESGEEAAVREWYSGHFADLVLQAGQAESAGKTIDWLRRLVRETDNYRGVFDWLEAHDPIRMIETAGKLISLGGQGYWWLTPTQSLRWLDRAIALGRSLEPPEHRRLEWQENLGICLGGMTAVCFALGRHEEGLVAGREAQDLLRPLKTSRWLAFVLGAVSFAAAFLGQYEEAKAAGEEARELALKYHLVWPLWISIGALGAVAMMTGDLAAAKAYVEEGKTWAEQFGTTWIGLQMQVMEGRFLSVTGQFDEARQVYESAEAEYRDFGDRSQGMIISSELAHLYRRLSRWEDALPRYRTTLDYFREVGHEAAVANTLENIAYTAVGLESPHEAGRLIGAAEAIRERTGNPLTIPWERADKDTALAQLSDMLGEKGLQDELVTGRGMSVDEAMMLGDRLSVLI